MSEKSDWKFKALIWLVATAIGLVASILDGCATATQSGKITVQPDTVYMGASGWVISYSPNMPKNPTASGAGWSFTFPSQDGVHYVMVPYHANKQHQTLTITYRVSGKGKFVSVDDPCRGAGFSPILERQGDTLAASQPFYRFWGTSALLVADGQVHTATYPLTYDKWTGVFGKTSQPDFDAAMKNLMGVGITFGGCYAGHGVYVSGGTAKFEMLNYQIQ